MTEAQRSAIEAPEPLGADWVEKGVVWKEYADRLIILVKLAVHRDGLKAFWHASASMLQDHKTLPTWRWKERHNVAARARIFVALGGVGLNEPRRLILGKLAMHCQVNLTPEEMKLLPPIPENN